VGARSPASGGSCSGQRRSAQHGRSLSAMSRVASTVSTIGPKMIATMEILAGASGTPMVMVVEEMVVEVATDGVA